MEKWDTIRMNAILPRRIVTIRLIKMLRQKNWMMLLFALWKVRQNYGCWIWEYHSMLLRVENYLRIMFQAIWGKCILVMTRRAMLLAKMKCRSNWTGCYGKFDKVRHVAKLEKEFDFYWAVGDRWLCDTWKISRWMMTIAHGKKYSTLNVTTDTYGPIVIAKGKEDLNLCHHRLDHMSSKRLEIMHLKGKLLSLKQVHIDMCESYILGKKKGGLASRKLV